jgi:hypothetical protein
VYFNDQYSSDLQIGDLSLSEQQHSDQQSHNVDAYLQFSAFLNDCFVVFVVGADAFISGPKKVTYSGRQIVSKRNANKMAITFFCLIRQAVRLKLEKNSSV